MHNSDVSYHWLFTAMCLEIGIRPIHTLYAGARPDRTEEVHFQVDPETQEVHALSEFEVPDGYRIKQAYIMKSDALSGTLGLDLIKTKRLAKMRKKGEAEQQEPDRFAKDIHINMPRQMLLSRALDLLRRPKMLPVDVLTDLSHDVVFEFRNGDMHLADKTFRLDRGYFVSSIEVVCRIPFTLRINLCKNSESAEQVARDQSITRKLPEKFRTGDKVTNAAIHQILKDWDYSEHVGTGTLELGCKWLGHAEYATPVAAFNNCVLTDIKIHPNDENSETDDRNFTLVLKYIPIS